MVDFVRSGDLDRAFDACLVTHVARRGGTNKRQVRRQSAAPCQAPHLIPLSTEEIGEIEPVLPRYARDQGNDHVGLGCRGDACAESNRAETRP